MTIGHYENFTAADHALSLDGYSPIGQDGMLGHIYQHVTTGEKLRAYGHFSGGYNVKSMDIDYAALLTE